MVFLEASGGELGGHLEVSVDLIGKLILWMKMDIRTERNGRCSDIYNNPGTYSR